jgi:hypothetical protein
MSLPLKQEPPEQGPDGYWFRNLQLVGWGGGQSKSSGKPCRFDLGLGHLAPHLDFRVGSFFCPWSVGVAILRVMNPPFGAPSPSIRH